MSGLPPPPTHRHLGCSQKPFAKGWGLPLAVHEGSGLASRSPSMWGLRSSVQNGCVGSRGQASCGQAGGGTACLLMLGLGPGQGKHSSEAFPATCRISQPSLWWPHSWQPGWGSESCQAPPPRDQRGRPSLQLPCGGQPPGVEAVRKLNCCTSAFSPALPSLPIPGN